jgi:hypothetical protein
LTNRSRILAVLALATLCFGAFLLREIRRAGDAERASQCRQMFCQGDRLPAYDRNTLSLFKVDGRFYLVPKAYGSGGSTGPLGFYWPSRAPLSRPDLAAEFRPGDPKHQNNYGDVAIEIFTNSAELAPSVRHGYAFLQRALASDSVQRKRTLRPGLDEYDMKHVVGEDGHFLDRVSYYVATDRTGVDGQPPVASCGAVGQISSGGTGFPWHGLWIGTRMSGARCADWPEIFDETLRVVNLIREAG